MFVQYSIYSLFPLNLEEEIPSYEFIKCYNRFVLNLSIEEREILIEKVKESYAFIEEMSKDDICLILGYCI